MSRRDMAADQMSVIENQSCGDFNRGAEKSLVRHYPYFLGEDGKWKMVSAAHFYKKRKIQNPAPIEERGNVSIS
jgi:hypothetical protein